MTKESIRELECHLDDSMEKLKRCGLNDEEAFLLAARRLGRVDALDAEFGKVDVQQMWTNRALLILLGLQGFQFVNQGSYLLGTIGQASIRNLVKVQQRYIYFNGIENAGVIAAAALQLVLPPGTSPARLQLLTSWPYYLITLPHLLMIPLALTWLLHRRAARPTVRPD